MAKVDGVRKFFKKALKSPIFYFCFLFVIINLFFTRQVLGANGVGGFIIIAVIEIIVELLCILALYKMKKRGAPIEKQFLLLALVLGSLFIVLLPPGQSPDDITHFRRIYGISDGYLLPKEVDGTSGKAGSEIPVGTDFLAKEPGHGTYSEVIDKIDDGTEQKSMQLYTTAALYSFVCYIPQIVGSLIGKLFGFSVLGMAYLMEIFNFVVWVFLVFFAIKLIPKFKSAVLFIALLPITLQEATSLSPDAIAIGLSLFFVSYIMFLAYGKRKLLEKRDYIILSICSIVIGFCKIVYLPLVLLLLLIPKEKYKSSKQRWLFLGILLAVVALLNLGWLMISSRYLVESRSGVNSKEQLMGIIRNPFKYLMVMFRSTNAYAYYWLSSMLGMSLGSFTFNLPGILFFVSFTMMVLLFIQSGESFNYKKADRWIMLFVFLVIVVLVMTSLYMQWTPYGEELVDGVQGRYYLPILMLVPMIICRKKEDGKYPALVSNHLILYYSLFVNVVALVTIFAQNA